MTAGVGTHKSKQSAVGKGRLHPDRREHGAAGVAKERISCVRDTYTFRFAAPPAELVDVFRKYYGPTMNAFEAAEKNGRSEDLKRDLDDLFMSQNKSQVADATLIPATYLRVTVSR